MRATCVTVGFVLAAATPARADRKIDVAIKAYAKHEQQCEIRRGGMTLVIEGVTAIQPKLEGADSDAVAKDLELVKAGYATQSEYCTKLAGILAFLRANSSYGPIAKDIAAREAEIAQLRAATGKNEARLDPVIKRLLARYQRGPVGPELDTNGTRYGERQASTFPSGRSIELPRTNGTWRLTVMNKDTDIIDYKDPTLTAHLYVEPFGAGTCDDQRKRLAAKVQPAQLVDQTLAEASMIEVAWQVRYVNPPSSKTQHTIAMCVARDKGGFVGSADVRMTGVKPKQTKAKDTKLHVTEDEFPRILVRMLQARTSAPVATPPSTLPPAKPASGPS